MAKHIFHVLTVCLFATLLFVSNAHATSNPPPTGGGTATSGGGTASETCLEPVRENLQNTKYNRLVETQEIVRGNYQPQPSAAETTCLAKQLLDGAENSAESFSDNVSEFCNDVKCEETMLEVVNSGSIPAIATFIASNPTGNPQAVLDLIASLGGPGLGGFGGFDECNGIENLFQKTLGGDIPFEIVTGAGGIAGGAGAIGGALQGLLGNPFGYSSPNYRPVSRVSEPVESRMPAEGECKRVDGIGDSYTCIAGPNTTCDSTNNCAASVN